MRQETPKPDTTSGYCRIRSDAPGASQPQQFLHSEFDEREPHFSPDRPLDRLPVRTESGAGPGNLCREAFPGPGVEAARISTGGGDDPSWRADSRNCTDESPDSHLVFAASLEVKGGEMEVLKVETLLGPLDFAYAPSADGQRFLAVLPPEGSTEAPLTVVQNWAADLKK